MHFVPTLSGAPHMLGTIFSLHGLAPLMPTYPDETMSVILILHNRKLRPRVPGRVSAILIPAWPAFSVRFKLLPCKSTKALKSDSSGLESDCLLCF